MSEATGNIATIDSNLHPWHTLGVKVDNTMGIDEALELVGADDHITTQPLYDQHGNEVDTHVQIVSDKYGHMWVAGNDYQPTQRRRLLELAYEIQGLSANDAHVETIGILNPRHSRFFAYLRFDDLVIDPHGIMDRVERGMYVATSFNQSWSNVFGFSNVRLACMNELTMRLKGLSMMVKARHTKNSEQRVKEAARALGYVGAVEEGIKRRAEEMLASHVGYGAASRCLNKVLDHHWPTDDPDLGDKARTRRINTREELRSLYEGPTCRLRTGDNGYAVYQAFTEWVDHHRGTRGGSRDLSRAEGAVFPGMWQDAKAKVADMVLT